MTIIRFSRLLGLCLALVVLLPSGVDAQSVPSDLADMNILELRQLDVRARALPGVTPADPERFHLAYRRVRSTFEDYRDGTKTLDDSDLIGPPNGTTYPILQDRIIQVVHSFEAGYDITRRLSIHLAVPYIYQRSEHHSIAGGPNFSEFSIESQGMGDLTLLGSYLAYEGESHSVTISPGVSFPTGSILEKGDTPLPGTENQLPYTMQLGSGTWDLVLGTGYQGNGPAFGWTGPLYWGAQVLGKIRTGQNSRGYRLGNRLLTSTWLGASPSTWIEPTVNLESQLWGRIDGNDEDFPGPIFPTPVADPDNFGGNKLTLMGRVALRFPELPDGAFYAFLSRQAFFIEYGRPVYQSLNGPQPEEESRLTFSWSMDF